jgi:hypothetical protein
LRWSGRQLRILHVLTSDLSQSGFLLFVSAVVAMLTRRLHLRYTVGLVLAGMALYFSHIYLKWHLASAGLSASADVPSSNIILFTTQEALHQFTTKVSWYIDSSLHS